MNYDDLDGSVLVSDKVFARLKLEKSVQEIFDRMEKVKVIGETIDGIMDEDLLEDAMEDEACHDLIANQKAIALGREVYNEFRLDELFGKSYTELREHNGLPEVSAKKTESETPDKPESVEDTDEDTEFII